MNRTVSAEESTISQDSDSPPKKKTGEIKKEAVGRTKSDPAQDNYECNYECSICLSWLKDPVLTKCGHRFCKACLEEWRKKEKNIKCPLDDMNLSLEDIFPDNYTKREIENMRKSFPEQFEPPNPLFECTFSTISCDFKTTEPQELNQHMEQNAKDHIDLLLRQYLKTQYQAWDPSEKSPSEECSTRELVNSLYERIVTLEQKNREQSAQIEKLQRMETTRNGTLIWRIEDFKKKVEAMQAGVMFYSSECYTEPNGYKFCARISFSVDRKDVIGFHIHLMKSGNDYHLSWPFVGKIKISMINVMDHHKSHHDILMTKPELQAFHRPQEEISTRGFGFIEYAVVGDIIKRGFIDNNCLTIKVQMNIV